MANADRDAQISQPFDTLRAQYEVVVVGSGYGGAVAASRLSRCLGSEVCLLERGREIVPGQYPTDLATADAQIQFNTPLGQMRHKTAMFEIHLNEDMNAVVGCGLGGTSLINANVALEIDFRLLQGEAWPEEIHEALLCRYYQRAREKLGAQPYPVRTRDSNKSAEMEELQESRKLQKLKKPVEPDIPNKLAALEQSAGKLGLPFSRPDINVTFKDRTNWAGVKQSKCVDCGDCCSGCNYTAKNTTLMNYLPDAYRHHAHIVCGASVDRFERHEDGWKVYVHETSGGPGDCRTVLAKVLIIAAGTLGTAGIMLRSQQAGALQTSFSPTLGKRFSGNGDVLGFSYNSYWKKVDEPEQVDVWPAAENEPVPLGIYGIGIGGNKVSKKKYPGPCITGMIDTRAVSRDYRDGMVIEEGVIPGCLADIVPAALCASDIQSGNFFRFGDPKVRLMDAKNLIESIQKNPEKLGRLSYEGPTSRTQTLLTMSHDAARGQLRIDSDGHVRIDWPGAGVDRPIMRDNEMMAHASDTITGEYLPNPLWTEPMGHQLLTVHPIGGCCLGKNGNLGVVNYKSQVFSGSGEAVYEDLYICDGSILPGSAGVNPLLTITALAEHACDRMIHDHGWAEPDTAEHLLPPPRFSAVGPTGSIFDRLREMLRAVAKWLLGRLVKLYEFFDPGGLSPSFSFTESMGGFGSLYRNSRPDVQGDLSSSYDIASRWGEAESAAWSVTLTVSTQSLHQMIAGEDHCAEIKGMLSCESLAPDRVKTWGSFNLFKVDRDNAEIWLMIYELDFKIPEENSERAGRYWMRGTKYLHDQPGSFAWTDLTTLYVDLCDRDLGSDGEDTVIGRGILRLGTSELIAQLDTFKLQPTRDWIKGIKWLARYLNTLYLGRFAEFFGETVFKTYGGILANLNDYPRKEDLLRTPATIRPLKAPKPVSYEFKAYDGAALKLTRYDSGKPDSQPVVLAPGFAVAASSFATPTVRKNLVEYLCDADDEHGFNYDVWLFDYRASPDSGSSTTEFDVDEIAEFDWPAAINEIHRARGDDRPVQAIAHCVGSMSLLMSILRGSFGKTGADVRNSISGIISSQMTLHPVTGWLNYAKADIDIVDVLAKSQKMRTVQIGDEKVKSADPVQQQEIDAALYNIPVPEGEDCKNPVCHRVFSVFGPTFLHQQLNHETHIALRRMFGEISVRSFSQIALIINKGRAVDKDGKDSYLPYPERLLLPINFIAGAENEIFYPESSQRTLLWLYERNKEHFPEDKSPYRRHVFKNYAHMDCFIGKDAWKPTEEGGIFPYLEQQLQWQRGYCSWSS